jgi:hypothetical protein
VACFGDAHLELELAKLVAASARFELLSSSAIVTRDTERYESRINQFLVLKNSVNGMNPPNLVSAADSQLTSMAFFFLVVSSKTRASHDLHLPGGQTRGTKRGSQTGITPRLDFSLPDSWHLQQLNTNLERNWQIRSGCEATNPLSLVGCFCG